MLDVRILEIKKQLEEIKKKANEIRKDLAKDTSFLYDKLQVAEETFWVVDSDEDASTDDYNKAQERFDKASDEYYKNNDQVDLLDDISYDVDNLVDKIIELNDTWENK